MQANSQPRKGAGLAFWGLQAGAILQPHVFGAVKALHHYTRAVRGFRVACDRHRAKSRSADSPTWKDEIRVYRLQTDDGQRIIGRRVPPTWVATTLADDALKLTAAQVHALTLDGKTVVRLSEGMELHRSRVMGVNRIELSGFTEAAKDRLKADGFISEIIS